MSCAHPAVCLVSSRSSVSGRGLQIHLWHDAISSSWVLLLGPASSHLILRHSSLVNSCMVLLSLRSRFVLALFPLFHRSRWNGSQTTNVRRLRHDSRHTFLDNIHKWICMAYVRSLAWLVFIGRMYNRTTDSGRLNFGAGDRLLIFIWPCVADPSDDDSHGCWHQDSKTLSSFQSQTLHPPFQSLRP